MYTNAAWNSLPACPSGTGLPLRRNQKASVPLLVSFIQYISSGGQFDVRLFLGVVLLPEVRVDDVGNGREVGAGILMHPIKGRRTSARR